MKKVNGTLGNKGEVVSSSSGLSPVKGKSQAELLREYKRAVKMFENPASGATLENLRQKYIALGLKGI